MSTSSVKANLTVWPTFRPLWRRALFLVSIAICPTVFWLMIQCNLDFVQQFYLRSYAKSCIRSEMQPTSAGRYTILNAVLENGNERIALPGELIPDLVSDGSFRLWVTELAKQHRVKGFRLATVTISNQYLRRALKAWVYPEIHFRKMAFWSMMSGVAVFFLFLPRVLSMDKKRITALKTGRRIEGPEMVSYNEFSERQKSKNKSRYQQADGLAYSLIARRKTFFGRTRGWIQDLSIRKESESRHSLFLADSGNGKSVLLKQNLWQIRDRGEAAVIYDPGAQFLTAFYTPGPDIVLNPLDARFPNWELRNEISCETDADAVAASMFPNEDKKNKFFEDSPRKIFKHLLMLRLSNEELIQCLTDSREIEKRTKGTELAYMIDKGATEQRAGVLSSLGMIADALRLIPHPSSDKPAWSTAIWARNRRGMIFVTSTHLNRDMMKPLITLWMDLLIARTMTDDANAERKVWYLIDEVGSLGYMASLKKLLTEGRKANCAAILAAQNPADFSVYGEYAKTMLSQPKTKIFLCTSGKEASEFASDSIGKVKLERFRESRGSSLGQGGRLTVNYQQETVVEPLVMASVIAGLPTLHGFLKHGNDVVQIEIPVTSYIEDQPAFIEREQETSPRYSESECSSRLTTSGNEPANGTEALPFFE